MILVLDASAAAEVLLKRPFAEAIREGLASCQSVIAPDIYAGEIANTLWKYRKAGALSRENGLSILSLAVDLVDHFQKSTAIIREALAEAVRLDHPVYDMLYFVLTRQSGGTLATLDRRLRGLAIKEGMALIPAEID